MSPVPAPAKVLVSGVNGYLGIWVVRKYLEAGYTVRGQVRSIAKAGKHLKDTFASYGDKFELVEVSDITAVCTTGPFSQCLILICGRSAWRIRRGREGRRCCRTHRIALPHEREDT